MYERKQMLSKIEKRLREDCGEEESMFHFHSSEDRIVFSRITALL